MSTQTTDLSDLITEAHTQMRRLRLDKSHPIIVEWLGKHGYEGWEALDGPGLESISNDLQGCRNQIELRQHLLCLLYPISVISLNQQTGPAHGTHYLGHHQPGPPPLPGSPLRAAEGCSENEYRLWLKHQYEQGTPALAEARRLLSFARQRPMVLSVWREEDLFVAVRVRNFLRWLQEIGF